MRALRELQKAWQKEALIINRDGQDVTREGRIYGMCATELYGPIAEVEIAIEHLKRLVNYTKHKETCALYAYKDCDCGLADILLKWPNP